MHIEKERSCKNKPLYPKLYFDYPEGETPEPVVYEIPYVPIIIYDAEGLPLARRKQPIGFDLNIEEE